MSSLSDAPTASPPPEDLPGPVETLDFRAVGLAWTVRRRGGGERRTFFTLQDLLAAQHQGEVGGDDALSSDGIAWRFLGRIEDIRALFGETWRQALADESSALFPGDPSPVEEPTRIRRAPTLTPLPSPATTPATAAPATEGTAPTAPAPLRGEASRKWMVVGMGVGLVTVLALGSLLLPYLLR